MKHEEYTLHRFFWPESLAILVIVTGGFSEGGNKANNLIIRSFTSSNSTGSSRIWMWARFWTWATRWISYKRYMEEICEKSGERGDDKNI